MELYLLHPVRAETHWLTLPMELRGSDWAQLFLLQRDKRYFGMAHCGPQRVKAEIQLQQVWMALLGPEEAQPRFSQPVVSALVPQL